MCITLTSCADTPESIYTPYVSVDQRNDTISETVITEDIPVTEPTNDQKDETDDTPATINNATPGNSTIEEESVPTAGSVDQVYRRPTAEERRLADMETYLKYCSVQATVETDRSACVIDVRTAENPYDVVWDYGYYYDNLVIFSDWSMVFDADYYMDQFPVLAYQYHYDEDLLLQHFQTVGVHEGRQGSDSFNVADYMSKCPEDVRDMFGDCYAAYYFYWMNNETNQSMDVSGNGQPKQMTAVMTAMQRYELKQVNALREELGIEPLVFDSELAAFGNFRAWIDAAEDWAGHDWLYANVEEVNKIARMFDGGYLSENTVKHYGSQAVNWYQKYYASKAHYNAMVDPDNVYVGCSNAYLGSCEHNSRGMVMVELDMFAGSLSTPMNH